MQKNGVFLFEVSVFVLEILTFFFSRRCAILKIVEEKALGTRLSLT